MGTKIVKIFIPKGAGNHFNKHILTRWQSLGPIPPFLSIYERKFLYLCTSCSNAIENIRKFLLF